MTSADSNLQRREVHFSGRVQGVGFRYTTRDIAQRFPVVGFVKNLPDGRVRLVVEGEGAALDRLIESVRQEMERFIVDVSIERLPATGEFSHFAIHY